MLNSTSQNSTIQNSGHKLFHNKRNEANVSQKGSLGGGGGGGGAGGGVGGGGGEGTKQETMTIG